LTSCLTDGLSKSYNSTIKFRINTYSYDKLGSKFAVMGFGNSPIGFAIFTH